MKRLLKISAFIVSLLAGFAMVIAFGFYWYISNVWKGLYTEEEILHYAYEIEMTPGFTQTFYGIYDKLYSDRHQSITGSFINNLLNKSNTHQTSWHLMVAGYLPLKHTQYAQVKLSFALEKYVSPEKCFDWEMACEGAQLSRNDTLFRGLQASVDTALIVRFLVMRSAPIRYRNDSILLKERVQYLQLKLQQ